MLPIRYTGAGGMQLEEYKRRMVPIVDGATILYEEVEQIEEMK